MANAGAERKLFFKFLAAFIIIIAGAFLVMRVIIPRYYYAQAEAAMAVEDYATAADLFDKVAGYGDATERALTARERAGEKSFWENTVEFGTYNGQPITWIVLDTDGDKTLLISSDVVDEQPYNEVYDFVTWDACTLRTWLNNDFYNAAFSDAEKTQIVTTHVVNVNNPTYNTDGGDDTEDNVFLLTAAEAVQYMPTRGNRTASDRWWLRGSGSNAGAAEDVRANGTVRFQGYFVWKNGGVRPVIWARL